ncbi:MAG TPA: glycosyltransferase family 1 protein [Salinimicrobium sp.]|nr:glycosyltransferase family 1 protein [Salinimicrobium sp.]
MGNKKQIFLESHNLNNIYFGFGQFNYWLIKSLAKQNTEFTLTVTAKNKSLIKDFEAVNFKKYHSFYRYKSLRIRKKYDLWHSMNQNTKIEPFHKIPYLLTVHNITHIKDLENYKNDPVHQRFQEKLNRSNAITYISNYAKNSTHQFFDVPDVPEYVIYNGNPIKEITISSDYKPSKKITAPFLFSIGEFTARKNFASLVKMMEILPDFNLILAGKNSTENGQEIAKLIEDKNLKDRIFLVGKISEADKQYYYQNCAAFVFPSLREGFGLPIIEAMRFGKPVFTSNNTSLPEIGGELAFYWEDYDPEYMADVFIKGMHKFEADKQLYREKMIARAQSFSWDEAAKQYLEVYKSLL